MLRQQSFSISNPVLRELFFNALAPLKNNDLSGALNFFYYMALLEPINIPSNTKKEIYELVSKTFTTILQFKRAGKKFPAELLNYIYQYLYNLPEKECRQYCIIYFLHEWASKNQFIADLAKEKAIDIFSETDDRKLKIFIDIVLEKTQELLDKLLAINILIIKLAALKAYTDKKSYKFESALFDSFCVYILFKEELTQSLRDRNALLLFFLIEKMDYLETELKLADEKLKLLAEQYQDQFAVALSQMSEPASDQSSLGQSFDKIYNKYVEDCAQLTLGGSVENYINNFLNTASKLLFDLELYFVESNKEIWLDIIKRLSKLMIIYSHERNVEAQRKQLQEAAENIPSPLMFNLFEAGIIDPGSDGDCGYSALAIGLVVIVLKGHFNEKERLGFYNFLNKRLSIENQTQLQKWIKNNSISIVIKELAIAIRLFVCEQHKNDYEKEKSSYQQRFISLYDLWQEKNQLEKDRSMYLVNLPRIRKLSEELSYHELQHFPEFLAVLNTAGLKPADLIRIWDRKKDIYFKWLATSRHTHPDPAMAAGDIRIYARHDDILKLANVLNLQIIIETRAIIQPNGKGILIDDITSLFTPKEIEILINSNVGEFEVTGFRLKPFLSKDAVLNKVRSTDQDFLDKLQILYEQMIEQHPIIYLINTGNHWQYRLTEAAAIYLSTQQSELRTLLRGQSYLQEPASLHGQMYNEIDNDNSGLKNSPASTDIAGLLNQRERGGPAPKP